MSPASPPLVSNSVRSSADITIPVHEFQGSTSKPLRPSYKRSSNTHSRLRSVGPFTELRRAWRKLLTEAPSLPIDVRPDVEILGRSTYAVAVGVCEGFAIPGFLFGEAHMEAFAWEVQRILQVESLVYIIHRDVLYVVNMDHIAANASKALQSALFVSFNASNKNPTLNKETIPEVLRGLNNLLDLTATKSSKVLDATELVGCDNDSYMDTLGDVLLGSPVAYSGASRQEVDGLMASEPCWTVSIGFEGFDPQHDHKIPLCSLPTSLFSAEALDSLDESPASPSISEICDAKQTHYFQRLNSSTMASSIWGEVSINVEGPGPYRSPSSSP